MSARYNALKGNQDYKFYRVSKPEKEICLRITTHRGNWKIDEEKQIEFGDLHPKDGDLQHPRFNYCKYTYNYTFKRSILKVLDLRHCGQVIFL